MLDPQQRAAQVLQAMSKAISKALVGAAMLQLFQPCLELELVFSFFPFFWVFLEYV